MNNLSKAYSPLATMRKLAVCAVVLFACATISAQAKDFKKLAKIDGVEHVHINKLLLKLAAKNEGKLDVGNNVVLGNDSGDMLKQLDAIDVYTSEKKDVAEQMGTFMRGLLNDNSWEPLIDMKDEDGQKVKIYQTKHGKNNTFVIFTEEEAEATLVVIKGKLDLAKMLEQQNDNSNKD